jgi:ubiquinone/menaquinone biosynthesis C-methylase UbiE
VIPGDILDIPLDDDSIDVVFCFETIEHIEDQHQVLRELKRVTRPGGEVIVGSVNKDGPNEIGGVEIFKGDLNPYHVKELGVQDFLFLFGRNAYYLQSVYNSGKVYDSSSWKMVEGLLSPQGICNYAVLNIGEGNNVLDI